MKILITQPYSRNLACAYETITEKYGAEVAFQPFIQHNPVPVPVFRKYKPDIKQYSSFIFATKAAVDYFFKLSEECSIKIPDTKKYFCINEGVSTYLRKYIEYRKRRIFTGKKSIEDLFPLLTKHKKDTFLSPCSAEKKGVLRQFCKKNGYKYKEIVVYEQGLPNLEGLTPEAYDIIVFFSPLTVESFAKHFPNYAQGNTKIATFNELTAEAVEKKGWTTSLCPPRLELKSVVEALDLFFRERIKEGSSK